MIKFNIFKNKWMWVGLFFFAIFIGSVISYQNVTARPQEDGTLILQSQDKNLGVSYVIGIDNLANEVNSMVEYDTSSLAGLNKFRQFNTQILEQIIENKEKEIIPAKITFNAPLTQEEFTSFVKNYGIEVSHYIIYMKEPDGKIATIQGSPAEGELIPTQFLNVATQSIAQEYNQSAQFLGWVEVNGSIPAEQALTLSQDKTVFMVDVMHLFLTSQLTDEVLATAGYSYWDRQNFLQQGFSSIQYKSVAWELYHLGIEK